jgi:site-specific DNA-methyltransferase (adenine-specific)
MFIIADCNQYLPTLESDSIDLIVTDIPYGIDYKSNKQNYDTRGKTSVRKNREEYFKKIKNDKNVPTEWLPEAYRLLKKNSAIYIFCHWKTWDILKPAVEEVGFKIKNMIVLNKSNHGMGDLKGSYAPKHELMLFATKGRHVLKFPEGRMRDVWDVPVKYSGAKRRHPNEKPLSWIEPCLSNSSKEGDLVLDPFAGCGTVGECCEKMRRRHISIEIDDQCMVLGLNQIRETKGGSRNYPSIQFVYWPS